MKRIIVEAQSHHYFRGLEKEQNYDQRGGLCQVGKGHAVVTTNPIDPVYLEYWKGLGFTIPHLITAGPFDFRYTLSELIVRKKNIQKEIKSFVNHSKARLELFCIEDTEAKLSQVLGIPAYCNFDLSLRLSRKILFKEVCSALSLSTPVWLFDREKTQLIEKGRNLIDSGVKILIKADKGIGGTSFHGIFKPKTGADIEAAFRNSDSGSENYFLEKHIDKTAEVSIHWMISEHGKIVLIDFFDQISRNFAYEGCSYPSGIPNSIKNLIEYQLRKKLGPYLIKKGGKGYFCCDIIIDNQGIPYWTDFNPRKGAIIYIWDMVRRLSKIHFNHVQYNFWHEFFQINSSGRQLSFSEIARKISDLIETDKKPFIVITNPGVIKFGWINITGISFHSKREALEIVEEAKRRLIEFNKTIDI